MTPPGVDGVALALVMSVIPAALIQLDLLRRKHHALEAGTLRAGQ